MDNKTRADLAKQVLDNPVYSEAVEVVRKAYIDRILKTAPDDDKTRARFYFAVHALEDIKSALTAFIQSGKIDEINELKKQKAKA